MLLLYSVLKVANLLFSPHFKYRIKRGKIMKFVNDKSGQGAAEYILLFDGVIFIAVWCTLDIQNLL